MKFKALASAVLACLLPLAAHADVIYEWSPLNGGLPHDVTLQLIFKDDTVAAGTASFHVAYQEPYPTRPDSGLASLYYAVPGVMPMSYRPAEEKFRNGLGRLDMEFNFTDDGYLTGWIRANDANSQFAMASTGNVMTITDARADGWMPGAGCGYNQDLCNGATGVIRRVGSVPEPVSVALLGAGALSLLAARRRRPRA